MIYSGGYAIVLVLHLLAAIFLIGPLGLAGTLSARWVKEGDLGALKAGHRTTKVYSLLAIIVPLLGIGLVQINLHGQWKMSQAWIGASLALVIVAIGVSLVVIAPAQTKAITALEATAAPLTEDPALEADADAHEPSKAELKAEAKAAKHPPASLELLTGRLQAASGVQMACWAVIVVLMVFKPGT